jgi:hypothetical protein
MDLTIDYKNKRLRGICEISLINMGETETSHIPLTLYRVLKVNSISDENDQNLLFVQKVVSLEDWEELQVNYIYVTLDKPIPKNGTKKLRIQYEGCLLGYTETGMSYVKDRIDENYTILRPDCQAYPELGVPSWKINRSAGQQNFDYQVTVTIPDSLVIANGGLLINKIVKNGEAIYTYKNIKPAWRIDIAIAKYGIMEDKENKLKVFYFPVDEQGAQNVLRSLKETLRLYSTWFGPLKNFDGFSIIEIPPNYGSQADVSCILQTQDAFNNKDQLYQLYHEISHLWNVKSLDTFPPRFESEGLATFLQFFMQEKLENKSNALKNGLDRIYKRLNKEMQENIKSGTIPMINYGKEKLTDLSYSKGMIFFYLLYKILGEKSFLETIGSFYQKYRDFGATADDFVKHVKNSNKMKLNKLFDEWIYTNASSKYIIEYVPVNEIINRYLEN